MDTGRIRRGVRSTGASAPSGADGNGQTSSPSVPVTLVGSGVHNMQAVASGSGPHQHLAKVVTSTGTHGQGGGGEGQSRPSFSSARAQARADQAGLVNPVTVPVAYAGARGSALGMLRNRLGRPVSPQLPAASGETLAQTTDITSARQAARALLAAHAQAMPAPPQTVPEQTSAPVPEPSPTPMPSPSVSEPTTPLTPQQPQPPRRISQVPSKPVASPPARPQAVPQADTTAKVEPVEAQGAPESPEPPPSTFSRRVSMPPRYIVRRKPRPKQNEGAHKSSKPSAHPEPLSSAKVERPPVPPSDDKRPLPSKKPDVPQSLPPQAEPEPERSSIGSAVAPSADPPPPPQPGPSRIPADFMGRPVMLGESFRVALQARLQEGLQERNPLLMPLRRALYGAAAARYMDHLGSAYNELRRVEVRDGMFTLMAHELTLTEMQGRMLPPVHYTNPLAAGLAWEADLISAMRLDLANGEVSARALERVRVMLNEGVPSREMLGQNYNPHGGQTQLSADERRVFLTSVMGVDERQTTMSERQSLLQQQLDNARRVLNRALDQGIADVSDQLLAVTSLQQALDDLCGDGDGWVEDGVYTLDNAAYWVYQRSQHEAERRLRHGHNIAIEDNTQPLELRRTYYRPAQMVELLIPRMRALIAAELERQQGQDDSEERAQLINARLAARSTRAQHILWESIIRRIPKNERTYVGFCTQYMANMSSGQRRSMLESLVESQQLWSRPPDPRAYQERLELARSRPLETPQEFAHALYICHGCWLDQQSRLKRPVRSGRLPTVPEDDEQPGPSGVGSPAPAPTPAPAPQPAPSSSSSSESSSDEEEVAVPVYPRPDRPAPQRPAPSRPAPQRPAPTRPSVSRPHPAPTTAPQTIRGEHLPGGQFRGHLTPEPERFDLPHYRPPFRDSVSRPGVSVVGPGANGVFSDIYLRHDETGLGNIGSVNAGTGVLYLGGGTINRQFAEILIGGRTPDDNPFQGYHRQILTLRPNTQGFIVPDLSTGEGIRGLRYTLCSPSDHEFGTVFVHLFDDNHCPNANGQNRAMVYIVPPDGRSPRYRDNQAFLDDVSETAARMIESVQAYNITAGQRDMPRLDIIRTCRFSSGNFARKGTTGADVARAIDRGITLGVFRIRDKGQRVTIKEIQFEDGNSGLFSSAGIVDRRALE